MSRRISLVLVLLCGCVLQRYPHTTVEAPAPQSTPEEKLSAYQTLRPSQAIMLPVLGGPSKTSISVGGIRLMNGSEVFYPEDLRPLIPEDSPAALWLNSYEKEQRSSKRKLQLSAALIFSGIGAFAVGTDLSFSGNSLGPIGSLSLAVSFPAVISGVILYSLGRKQRFEVATFREEFFGSYDDALLSYLHLCRRGAVVVDCDQPESQPTSQPGSQPASTPATNPTASLSLGR